MRGKFTDDCMLYRTGPNSWMTVLRLRHRLSRTWPRDAAGKNVAILFDDDLQDLSLQGPLAVKYLAKHVPGHQGPANISTTCRPACSASR